MRSTDPVIISRLNDVIQTISRNSNPEMEVVVTRSITPITRKEYWQESIVTAGATATCTSVAVKKTGKNITDVYVAYVSGGVLTVKKAAFVMPIKNMVWSSVKTISGVHACAVEFDGRFIHGGLNVEYRTEEIPWLFYTTVGGELWAGLLGAAPERMAASGATAIDVVRGVSSAYEDIDQGLIVFYIQNGSVFYRQWINGTWEGQQAVSIAPANAVAIKVERLFDYRICIQATDSAGALWEVFTKMEASGWNGTEYIAAKLTASCASIPINLIDCRCHVEHIAANITTDNKVLYALSPVMMTAVNVDDGSGNYGRFVEIAWDENIFGESENVGQFTITDSGSGAWSCISAVKNGKVLTLEFMDFNNAINPVTVTYASGTMTGDVVAVESDSLSFTAANLVPSATEPPVPISTSIPDDKTIIITFDKPVSSGNWTALKDGFAVTADEYDMIPEGTAAEQAYTIDTIAHYAETHVDDVDITSGAMNGTEVVNGVIQLELDT